MGFNVPDWRILTIHSRHNALTMCVPVDEVERMLSLQVGQWAFGAVAACCMIALGVLHDSAWRLFLSHGGAWHADVGWSGWVHVCGSRVEKQAADAG